jgi:hypothetical protein
MECCQILSRTAIHRKFQALGRRWNTSRGLIAATIYSLKDWFWNRLGFVYDFQERGIRTAMQSFNAR